MYSANTHLLYILSTHGAEAVVELLMEFAQDIGAFTDLGQNDAVADTSIAVDDESSNMRLTRQIIARWPFSIGHPFVGYAAERGFARLARVAIQHAGHAVDNPKREGQTPFSLAAQGRINHAGRLAIMKYLHEAHANPNTPDEYGKTPLHYAVQTPFNDEIIQFLVSTCKINLESEHISLTALALAVKENRTGYVQILLAAGADPMTRFWDGSTMLMYTVKKRNMRIFDLFFNDPRCEHNAIDLYGRTALSWCATVGDELAAKMMSKLLKTGTVDPNSRDNEVVQPWSGQYAVLNP